MLLLSFSLRPAACLEALMRAQEITKKKMPSDCKRQKKGTKVMRSLVFVCKYHERVSKQEQR